MRSVKITTVAAIMALSGSAFAYSTEDAKIIAQEAVAHIKHVGFQQAFSDFSKPNGEFSYGPIYTYCYSKDGTTLANGGNPKLVGTKMTAAPRGVELVANGAPKTEGYVIQVDEAVTCGTGTR